jgi:hypothetical protein
MFLDIIKFSNHVENDTYIINYSLRESDGVFFKSHIKIISLSIISNINKFYGITLENGLLNDIKNIKISGQYIDIFNNLIKGREYYLSYDGMITLIKTPKLIGKSIDNNIMLLY